MADEMMGAFAAFRRQLESHVSLTEAQIRSAWRLTLHLLQRDITIWTDKYSAKLKEVREQSGNPKAQVPLSWLYDTYGGDWKSIKRSVTAQVGAFGEQSLAHILAGQGLAALLGSDAGRQTLIHALRPISRLVNPERLVETTRNEARQSLVGRSISGKHLPTLLKGLGEDAANRVHKGLLAALSTGENPRTAAGLLHHALGDSYNRALTVARTEMVGAYRDAQLLNYRQNSDVVGQWMWSAAKQGRTCFQCIWMDGSLHDLSETFDSHPCCRCSPVPVTKGWDEILGPLGIDSSDIPDTRVTANYESGQDWFNRQSEQTQRHMLGPAAFSAWQEGDLKLGDLVGQHDDGQWYQKSLREIGINARDYLGAWPERYVPEPEPEPEVVPEQASLGTVDEIKARERDMRDLFATPSWKLPDDKSALDHLLNEDPAFQQVAETLDVRTTRDAYERLIDEYHQYAGGSSSAEPLQILLQEAARREFGIESAGRSYSATARDAALSQYGDALPGVQHMVRAIYDRTQALLQAQGITEVQVFRGMRWNEGAQPDWASYDGSVSEQAVGLQAMSSFSTTLGRALDFANGGKYDAEAADYAMIVAGMVPADRIFSLPFTGFGALPMQEVLLLGGDYNLLATGWTASDGRMTPRMIYDKLGTQS